MIGLATIGNATLIAYDDIPILSTDPWFGDEDPAYFGSWICSHEIPNDYKNDILRSKYLWFSHGHPDHTNPISLERFKDNKILLPDHYGSRIYKDLKNMGYDVQVLKDKNGIGYLKIYVFSVLQIGYKIQSYLSKLIIRSLLI